jgi:hypothetical protein
MGQVGTGSDLPGYPTNQELTAFSREYDLSMKYYPLLYRLRNEAGFLIWISNGDDSVLVDADGSVPSFKDLKTLESFAEKNGIPLESETPLLHDLDWVASWRIAQNTEIECVRRWMRGIFSAILQRQCRQRVRCLQNSTDNGPLFMTSFSGETTCQQ